MTDLSESSTIIPALRAGLVPKRGLERLATGLDDLMAVIGEELEFVADGNGLSKWIRGEYGTGKTFATRQLCANARARGFATSEVQISINDTPLHHLETVYRRLIERLETAADGPNAFPAIVQSWLYQIGEEVIRLRGLSEDDPEFADATEQRLEDKLADLSRRNSAYAQVLRAYHRAEHDGDFAAAQGMLAWLAGQPHVGADILKAAGVKGKVDGQASLTFLAGLLTLLRQSGHAGLVVVLDEVETVQRMNSISRERSLDSLRKLMDMLGNGDLPGLYLVVTGTRDFYEGYKGLKSYAALYQRVQVSFEGDPRFDNLRAPQVRLLPFTEERLLTVGKKVRDLYPAKQRARVEAKIDDDFLRAMVSQITSGFRGSIAIAPRVFLRELVDVIDRVDQHEGYEPREHYKLDLSDSDGKKLMPEELAAVHGREAVYAEAEPDTPESAADDATPESPRRKRLDG